jgi:hypothetical protein
MFILNHIFPCRIPCSTTTTTRKGGGKISCLSFFCSHKFHKIVNYFFGKGTGKNWSQLTNNYSIFIQKMITKLSEIVGLGSGIPKKPTSDPGVKTPDSGSGFAILYLT